MDITLTLNTVSKPDLKCAQELIAHLLAQGVQERLETIPGANPISPEAYRQNMAQAAAALNIGVVTPAAPTNPEVQDAPKKRTRRTKAEMEAAKAQVDPTINAAQPAETQKESASASTSPTAKTAENTPAMATSGADTPKQISQADIRTALLDLIKKVGPVQAKKVLADLGYPNVGSVPNDKTSEVHAGIQAAGVA